MFEEIIKDLDPCKKFNELRSSMSDDIFFNKISRYDLFLLLRLEYSVSEFIWNECVKNVFGIVQIMNAELYTPKEIMIMNSIKITDSEIPKICVENGIRFYITINDLKYLSNKMFQEIKQKLFTENDKQYLIFKKGTERW
jgi:hypothetical protein